MGMLYPASASKEVPSLDGDHKDASTTASHTGRPHGGCSGLADRMSLRTAASSHPLSLPETVLLKICLVLVPPRARCKLQARAGSKACETPASKVLLISYISSFSSSQSSNNSLVSLDQKGCRRHSVSFSLTRSLMGLLWKSTNKAGVVQL